VSERFGDPGAIAPETHFAVKIMKIMQPWSGQSIDVAIDQAVASRRSMLRRTRIPPYIRDGIVHLRSANDGLVVARTSRSTLPTRLSYGEQLANKGWKKALKENPALEKGLNIVDGNDIFPAVAEASGLPFTTRFIFELNAISILSNGRPLPGECDRRRSRTRIR